VRHEAFVRWLHAEVNTPAERTLWSVALLVALALVAGVVYLVGPRLKDRMDEEVAEAVQSVVVTATGAIVAGLLIVIWKLSDALNVVTPSATDGVKVMLILLVFAGAYTSTRITKRFVKEGAARDAITAHQREVLHHVVQIAIFAPAVLFAFALWGTDPADLLLGAGVLGIVLGLAARQTLGAMLAGFVVLFSRPFEVGDWIVVDDHEGIVTDITVVNTRIRTFDDEQVMIPNDTVTSTEVVNRSRNGRLRIQVDVGVDYDADIERAAEVALAAMDDLDELMDHPEPDVAVERFGDSAVVLNLRFWISNPSIDRKWDAQNAVMSAVKDAFEQEEIKIPFPQRELVGREEAGGLRLQGGTDAAEAPPDASAEDGGAADAEGDGDETEPAVEEVEDAPASTDEDDD